MQDMGDVERERIACDIGYRRVGACPHRAAQAMNSPKADAGSGHFPLVGASPHPTLELLFILFFGEAGIDLTGL